MKQGNFFSYTQLAEFAKLDGGNTYKLSPLSRRRKTDTMPRKSMEL